MSWQDPPHAGETWRRRKDGKQETRHVYDWTLGGDVCYRYGNWRNRHRAQCSEEAWAAWVEGARKL